MKIATLIILVLSCAQTSFAAVASQTKQVFKPVHVLSDGSLAEVAPGTAEYEKFVSEWKKTHSGQQVASVAKSSRRRSPASGENLAQKLSPAFSKMRNTIQSLSSGDDFAQYLEIVKQEYDSYPADAKIVANELIEFSNLRGIVYRMTPLLKKRNMDHSMLLTFVMRVADAISFYRPYPQWKAAFDFLTEPYDDVVQFNSMQDFQAFVGGFLFPASKQSIDRLQAIDLSDYIVWDNSFFFGQNMIPDSYDRYTIVQNAEKEVLLAAKYRGLANMDLFRAYDWDDIFNISKDISGLYLGDSILGMFGGDNIRGASPNDISDKVKAYANFGKRFSNGPSLSSDALGELQQMVLHLDNAWTDLKANKGKNDRLSRYMLNRGLADLYSRDLDAVIPAWKAILSGQTTLSSRVVSDNNGGQKNKVAVDVPAFFTQSPTDLKSLLPVGFEDNSSNAVSKPKTVNFAGKATSVQYHNYLRGAGKTWSHKAYQTLFPELSQLGPGDADIAETSVKSDQQVLMQSWGGGLIAFPLSMFMF